MASKVGTVEEERSDTDMGQKALREQMDRRDMWKEIKRLQRKHKGRK